MVNEKPKKAIFW